MVVLVSSSMQDGAVAGRTNRRATGNEVGKIQMQNTPFVNPDVATMLAHDRQADLLAVARRSKVVVRPHDPGAVSALRGVLGTLMVRAGTRVAGRQPASALIGQPAA